MGKVICVGPLVASLITAVALGGCSKDSSGATATDATKAGPVAAEVANVQKAFASAEPRRKFAVDDTLRIVRAGGYADGLRALQELSRASGLTPEQKASLQELTAKVEPLAAAQR